MESPFVWFDLRTDDAAASRAFYEQLLGWEVSDVSVGNAEVPMIGNRSPWASIVSDDTDLADGSRTSRSTTSRSPRSEP